MKYGSVNNLLAGSNPDTVPVVGMGATLISWSDRYPYTIIQVITDRKIVVQEDNATRIDSNGVSESQNYEYSPNPDGQTYTLTKRKNGQWKVSKDGTKFAIGYRSKYYDYSF